MRFVDLSVHLDNETPLDPPFLRPKIEYKDHQAGLTDMFNMYGITADQLPDGQGLAAETVSITTHSGTHVDAPWHYHPTQNNGEKAWTIDEVPLDWFFRPGVKIDLRDLPNGTIVKPHHVEEALAKIDYELQPFDICLFHTIASSAFGSNEYIDTGIGFGDEITMWLTEKGIRVVGTDAWGWDLPVSIARKLFEETGDATLVWDGHKAGRRVAYCQIEKLHNLESIPATGFTVACFPTKVRAASAGWTRAVAIFDN